MNEPTHAIVPLSAVGAVDPELIGGKASGFATITRAGLTVPDGFVLTTPVHRAAGDGDGTIPQAIADDIAELVGAFGDAPLAVRSSASGEDGADHSHAGQYLTRLGVRGARDVLQAILDCWASADGDRAEAYRLHRGHGGPVAMAVIVQRLAAGEAAGVCMSCDPVTADRATVVVNASWGLGELVVSGLVTPDDYRLARDGGRLLGFEPGYKDVMLVMDGDGAREVEVPEERREARVLDDALLLALHDGVLRCEEQLGHPADCEFSIVDGRVVWLQCRPMTALAPIEPHTTTIMPSN